MWQTAVEIGFFSAFLSMSIWYIWKSGTQWRQIFRLRLRELHLLRGLHLTVLWALKIFADIKMPSCCVIRIASFSFKHTFKTLTVRALDVLDLITTHIKNQQVLDYVAKHRNDFHLLVGDMCLPLHWEIVGPTQDVAIQQNTVIKVEFNEPDEVSVNQSMWCAMSSQSECQLK